MTQDKHGTPPAAGLGDDLDRGRGRDKNPYPDPSAAPLGTDDEAAGTPISPEQLRMAREHELRKDATTDSAAPAVLHGHETREFDSDATLQPPRGPVNSGPGPSRPWMTYAVGAIIALVVLWFLLGR